MFEWMIDTVMRRTRVTVAENQRVLVLSKGRFAGILGPGRHGVPGRGQSLELETFDLTNPVFVSKFERALMHQRPDLVDAHLAKTTDGWMLDSGFSVCDIYLATCCRWLMIYPVDEGIARTEVARRQHLWRLLERVEQRPAYGRACEAEWIDGTPLTDPRPAEPPFGSVTG